MAHTRVYPMDSQRFDMTKRAVRQPKRSNGVNASISRSPALVDRYQPRYALESQRYDPLARSIPRRAGRYFASVNITPDPLSVAKISKRDIQLLSRLDSQRYDPTLKTKFYNLNSNAQIQVNHDATGITGKAFCSSPEPMTLRELDEASTALTDGSLLDTSRDGLFESRSNFAQSSMTSISQYSDTSTPWRTESTRNEAHHLPSHTTSDTHQNKNVLRKNSKTRGDKARRREFYVLKTSPRCTNFLCGLDCRSNTLTRFDIVHPPMSGSAVPAVIRLP